MLYLVTLDIEILGVVDKSIYLLLFLRNIFKFRPGSFAHECFYPWSTRRSGGLHLVPFAF